MPSSQERTHWEWMPTGRLRIRSAFFGACIEELYESHDGRRQWRRANTSVELTQSYVERLNGHKPPPAHED